MSDSKRTLEQPRGEERGPRPWWIIVVLLLTIFGFAGSSVYSRRVAAKLDESAISIATNASPSIEHLTAARGELIRIAVDGVFATGQQGAVPAARLASLNEALDGLRRELSAYVKLPFYPHEQPRYAELESAMFALENQLSHLSQPSTPGGSAASKDVSASTILSAVERVDHGIEQLVQFNAREQHRLALEIPKRRHLAAQIGFRLQGICAALSVILMVLVARGLWNYERLLLTRRQLVAARARDAAAFAERLESTIRSSVRVAGAITGAHDSATVFQVIADEARALVDAQYCAVGCGTDPARPFEPWVQSGTPPPEVEALGPVPRPVGLFGAVTRASHSIRLEDPSQDPSLPAHPPGAPLGPFLGVPIIHRGQNVTNLFLIREPHRRAFSDQEERAAELLASYLAVAIANARLYGEALAATRTRDDLLATVSHDLKNPLGTIALSANRLRRRVQDSTVADLSTRIERSVERMSRLIGDLLDAAKIESGSFHTATHPEEVSPLVDSALDMFRLIAGEKRIHLDARVPTNLPPVLCDREMILRVFANLIGNAIKFSPQGTSVVVGADPLPNEVCLSVQDAGPGIPAAQLQHIFDRYWQEKESDRRGTGLGLFIAKGIVEAHGGRIWIRSEPTQGTTLYFTLPRSDREALPAAAA